MTALNIFFDKEMVVIAMDTLARDEGGPKTYVSKMFPLPHLNGVMCGTESLGLMIDWFANIQTNIVARDVSQLNQFTPGMLLDLSERYNLNLENTTTIYQFGFSDSDSVFKGYNYRSTDGFASQELEYQWRFKPEVEINNKTTPEETLIRATKKQRVLQRMQPLEQRTWIGGDIIVAVLTPGKIEISRNYRFDNYDEDYIKMVNRMLKDS